MIDAGALDNRFHSAEREYATAVMSNDDLLPGDWMSPLLVATGGADPKKTVTAKNSDDLV